jgi:HD superfamily phosphohydrolase
MSASIDRIPELRALDSRTHLLRIPPEIDVPLTTRVRRIIDTADFRRLTMISQLGLVSHVYPAAIHTRFEHALGVYRMALLYLRRLQYDKRFARLVTPADAETFIVAALLHDVGHWPFCHPIEDMQLAGVPQHEVLARRILAGELAEALVEDWGISAEQVVRLLAGTADELASRLFCGMLSGPIDVDKMDYLMRDSLHAGVPYGRNLDQQRLIGSLCLNRAGDALALTDKGRTAAELMVFARYIMFSEVYWHHAVRAATAMFQRAFYLLHREEGKLNLTAIFSMTERALVDHLVAAAGKSPAGALLAGLFGPRRALYKRWGELGYFQNRARYQQLARKPYPWLVACAENLAAAASQHTRCDIAPHHVLIDAPPVELEVEFDIDIYFANEDCYRRLGDVSPVVKTLALHQFDDFVKRVRVFVAPAIRDQLHATDIDPLLDEAIEQTEEGR